MDKEDNIRLIAKSEGLTFEEAKLSYAKRQKLPDSAFCGPNRTYPAHDKAHVRNGLARLGTFGKRLKPAVRKRILACLKRRAKRYGIEVSETVAGKLIIAKGFDETVPEKEQKRMQELIKETLEWAEAKKKLWIQSAIKRKGALRSRLGK